MWNYIDIFDSLNIHDSFLEFNESSFTVENEVSEELLKFIPDGGIEDAAKIVLENGESINVWKSNNKIFGVPGAKDTDAKPATQCDQKNLSNIILRALSSILSLGGLKKFRGLLLPVPISNLSFLKTKLVPIK